jgi:hypothetical protein
MAFLGASTTSKEPELCNASGAVSHAQIKAAVKKIWKKVTPHEMEKAVATVKRNMARSAAIKNNPGGNFYNE